jgi:hypothetical protein
MNSVNAEGELAAASISLPKGTPAVAAPLGCARMLGATSSRPSNDDQRNIHEMRKQLDVKNLEAFSLAPVAISQNNSAEAMAAAVADWIAEINDTAQGLQLNNSEIRHSNLLWDKQLAVQKLFAANEAMAAADAEAVSDSNACFQKKSVDHSRLFSLHSDAKCASRATSNSADIFFAEDVIRNGNRSCVEEMFFVHDSNDDKVQHLLEALPDIEALFELISGIMNICCKNYRDSLPLHSFFQKKIWNQMRHWHS